MHGQTQEGDLRLPPGQGATSGFPVLHVGPVPDFDPQRWRLRVHGAVRRPLELAWEDLEAFEHVELELDWHCVTGWSKLGCRWGGVPLWALAEVAGVLPSARFLRLAEARRYDTSVPLEHALAPDALLATHYQGQPLEALHGGPLRAFFPRLYAWKSCKWLAELEFLEHDRLGYWEVRGYHNQADPWREQRLV